MRSDVRVRGIAAGLAVLAVTLAIAPRIAAANQSTGFVDAGPAGLGDTGRPQGLIAAEPDPAPAPPSLAFEHFAAGKPELRLAQRTIEREWGPANDSLDLRKRAAGWKSEPFAFSASALLPGAGQAYAGENSAIWYALAEAAGWTARWFFRRDADRNRDDAVRIAGDPADSTSGWSFQRWEAGGSGRDASQLRALWIADRSAFYTLIGSDPQYLDGWGGADPSATRESFEHDRDLADSAVNRGRWSEIGLGVNHLFAAVDALRAARAHNLPVRRNLDLALRGHWGRRGPSVVAILERRF